MAAPAMPPMIAPAMKPLRLWAGGVAHVNAKTAATDVAISLLKELFRIEVLIANPLMNRRGAFKL
jgi:hypothetical protein